MHIKINIFWGWQPDYYRLMYAIFHIKHWKNVSEKNIRTKTFSKRTTPSFLKCMGYCLPHKTSVNSVNLADRGPLKQSYCSLDWSCRPNTSYLPNIYHEICHKAHSTVITVCLAIPVTPGISDKVRNEHKGEKSALDKIPYLFRDTCVTRLSPKSI